MRLTTTAAMPASTALASGDDSMSVSGFDPGALWSREDSDLGLEKIEIKPEQGEAPKVINIMDALKKSKEIAPIITVRQTPDPRSGGFFLCIGFNEQA